jgi:hypothetical protein
MRVYGRLALIGLALVLSGAFAPAEPAEEGYVPVSPPSAVHTALRSSLKEIRDWLGGKDFASAAQEAQGLVALAHLYANQGGDPAWREKTAALADAAARLAAAAGKQDAAGCDQYARDSARLLDDLAGRNPGARPAGSGFKPQGGTRTWMLLLDSAFTDAKWAKASPELEGFARTVAEEANVVQYLRDGASWRQSARQTRAAALEVAAKAKANDFPAAKAALKAVSRQCQACHEQSNRR